MSRGHGDSLRSVCVWEHSTEMLIELFCFEFCVAYLRLVKTPTGTSPEERPCVGVSSSKVKFTARGQAVRTGYRDAETRRTFRSRNRTRTAAAIADRFRRRYSTKRISHSVASPYSSINYSADAFALPPPPPRVKYEALVLPEIYDCSETIASRRVRFKLRHPASPHAALYACFSFSFRNCFSNLFPYYLNFAGARARS